MFEKRLGELTWNDQFLPVIAKCWHVFCMGHMWLKLEALFPLEHERFRFIVLACINWLSQVYAFIVLDCSTPRKGIAWCCCRIRNEYSILYFNTKIFCKSLLIKYAYFDGRLLESEEIKRHLSSLLISLTPLVSGLAVAYNASFHIYFRSIICFYFIK